MVIFDMLKDLLSKYPILIYILPIIVLVVYYFPVSYFLNRLHKQLFEKNSIIAWIPIFRLYSLGKVTLGSTVGFVLLLGLLLVTKFDITTNNYRISFGLFNSNIYYLVLVFFIVLVISLFVVALFKYYHNLNNYGVVIPRTNYSVATYDYSPVVNNVKLASVDDKKFEDDGILLKDDIDDVILPNIGDEQEESINIKEVLQSNSKDKLQTLYSNALDALEEQVKDIKKEE